MAFYGKEEATRQISEAIAHIIKGSTSSVVSLSEMMVCAAECAKRKNLTEESVMYWQNLVNRIDDVLNKRLQMIGLKPHQTKRIKRNQERSFKIILCEEA